MTEAMEIHQERVEGRGTALRSGFYQAYEFMRQLNMVLAGLAAVLIVLINLMTLWGVFTRYFLRDPATWTYPISSYLLLYVIYLGTAYTLQQGGHVRMEFVVEALPPRMRLFFERLQHFLGLAFILIFLWQGWRIAERAIREGQRDLSMLSIPLSITTIAIPIGLVLMTITYLFMIVEAFLGSAPITPAKPQPQESLDT